MARKARFAMMYFGVPLPTESGTVSPMEPDVS